MSIMAKIDLIMFPHFLTFLINECPQQEAACQYVLGSEPGSRSGEGQENKLNKSLRDPPVNREIGRQACLKTLPSVNYVT